MNNWEEAEKYFGIAMKYIKNDDYEEAISYFTKAIETAPKYKEAYCNRGSIYKLLNKYEEAINDYSETIQIDPKYKEAYCNRAALYNKLKQYQEAINDCGKAIRLDSQYGQAYSNRAITYSLLGNYEEAIDDYNTAIKINSEDVAAYFGIAVIYGRLGNYEEAISNYQNVIQKCSCFRFAYYNMGILYIEMKDFSNAQKNFEIFLEMQKQKDTQNSNPKIISNELNEANKRNIQGDVLSLIKYILLDDLLNDIEKSNLLQLIYRCYELMDKIKIKPSELNEKKLVHYTRIGSLKFLVKKKANFGKLRLSNAIYMNDPEEGQIFRNLLLQYKDNEHSNIFHNEIDIKNYTYLTCFCPYEKKDVLPMWVHYGEGGTGVGLVFNETFFENQPLYKVQYIDTKNFDIKKTHKDIRKELKKIFNFLSRNCFKKSENEQFLEYTNIIIDYISYLFKDKAYDYENEIRMIQFRDYESEDIIINEASDIPKLCIEYKKEITAKNCVEVIAGPKANYIEIAAYSKYVGIAKVSQSEIKYR